MKYFVGLLISCHTAYSFSLPGIFCLPSRRENSELNCICINCKHVVNCEAYHFVEDRHQQAHICEKPTFDPRNGSPTLNLHIQDADDGSSNNDAVNNAIAAGVDVMAAPEFEMILEYDVVACDDFVEDKGCWVRNMPEEIRLSNPDFVPS